MTTLLDLVNIVGSGPRTRALKSRVSQFWRKPRGRRFLFLVKSRESYSSKAGHIVSILYPNVRIPFSELWRFPRRSPTNTRVRVFCSCQAWKYTGPAYLSTREKYRLPETKYREDRPANVRDPNEENYVCKHVVRVATWLRPMTFRRMLYLFQVPDVPAQRRAMLEELAPIVGSALRARNYTQSEIDDVIATLDEHNAEDVLDTHGLICAEGDHDHD